MRTVITRRALESGMLLNGVFDFVSLRLIIHFVKRRGEYNEPKRGFTTIGLI